MEPIPVDKMSMLQKNTCKAEAVLRDIHHKGVNKEATI